MSEEPDDEFFNRADAHIHLSNAQVEGIGKGKVSASMLYATARFNAWVSASGFESSQQMREAKSESMKYFLAEYEKMLSEHLDDYIENFDGYMLPTH